MKFSELSPRIQQLQKSYALYARKGVYTFPRGGVDALKSLQSGVQRANNIGAKESAYTTYGQHQ